MELLYVATKHAQAGLAQSLGMQADEQKLPVRVALFLPGAMKTPFWNGRDLPADICFQRSCENCYARINAIGVNNNSFQNGRYLKNTLVETPGAIIQA